jgi:hypothetical protein
MEQNLIIAIIDDGISSERFQLKPILRELEVNDKLEMIDCKNTISTITHGTYCAAIIKKYAPKSILYSIKILDNNTKRSGINLLIKAIEWCIQENIKIINLSLGTIDFRDYDEIRAVIDKAYYNGVKIIAAFSNDDIYTIPSAFSNVIGVKYDLNYKDDEYRVVKNSFSGVDVYASSKHIIIDKYKKKYITKRANSFATPLITAEVFNIISKSKDITLEEIKYQLYKKSSEKYDCDYNYNIYFNNNIDWIQSHKLLIIKHHKIKHNYIRRKIFIPIKLKLKEDKYIVLYDENNHTKALARIIKFLVNNSTSIIIYNDKKEIYKEIKKNRVCGRIWDKDNYIQNIENEDSSEILLDIPIITIICNHKWKLSYILSKLNLHFIKEEYNSRLVSNSVNDIIIGAEYCPNTVDTIKFIKKIYNKYQNDVFIVGQSNRKSLKQLNEVNIEISESRISYFNNNKLIKFEEYIEMNEKIISEIYKFILEVYN